MKKIVSSLGLISLSLLLGAGCQLPSLSSNSSDQGPRGYADVKVTDNPPTTPSQPTTTPTTPSTPTTPTPSTPSQTPSSGEPQPSPASPTTPPSSTTTPSTPSKTTGIGSYGGVVINPVTMKADANSIIVMLTTAEGTYSGSDAYMQFGCGDKLVPVRVTVTKTQSDLATALVQLLTIKKDAYSSQGLTNIIALSKGNVHLTNVSYDGKTRVVDFTGQFTSGGTCDDPRIKAQIEETVKLYATDYRIQLNGSATAWKCLGDESGQCQ